MYIAKDFAEYATPLDFFTNLKEYLANIGVFTLTEENFTELPYYFKLKCKDVVIKFECNNNYQISCYCYLLIDEEEILRTSITINSTATVGIQAVNRSVKLLLIKNGNNLVFKIGSYNSEILSYANTVRMIIFDNELYCFVSGNNTSASATDINGTSYTYKPYHTYSKSATELFLDPELPWINTNDGSFYSNSTGVTGLGGAECGKLYQLENGTKYYAVFDNIAIPIGEEVEVIV